MSLGVLMVAMLLVYALREEVVFEGKPDPIFADTPTGPRPCFDTIKIVTSWIFFALPSGRGRFALHWNPI